MLGHMAQGTPEAAEQFVNFYSSVWSCYEYADMLLNAGGDPSTGSGRAKAMALLDEGLKIARELSMRPLMERVLARREILSA